MRLNDETPENDPPLGGAPTLRAALATIATRRNMTQLEGQRVISAVLKHGDPAVALRPGTRATLVWQRSYREAAPVRTTEGALTAPLRHEYEAYAYNDEWEFVRIQVTDAMIEDVHIPTSE